MADGKFTVKKVTIRVGTRTYANAPQKAAQNWVSVSPNLLYISFATGRLYFTDMAALVDARFDDAQRVIRFVYRGEWESEGKPDRVVSKPVALRFERPIDYQRVKQKVRG